MNYYKQGEDCEKLDRESAIACKFDVLYKITAEQDRVNLSLLRYLNEDEDPRWTPIHMIDNANAIILGLSRNKGNPQAIVEELYVKEKVDSLNTRWLHIQLEGAKK
jgi:hypothetical protein